MTIISNGLFVTGGMTVYGGAYFQTPAPVTFSDRRLKTRIEQLEKPLSKVSQLRGVYFSWVSDEESGMTLDERRHVGLIAQDVQAVLPEVVHEMSAVTPHGESYLGVNYAEMVPLLLEAIRELDERTSSPQIPGLHLTTRVNQREKSSDSRNHSDKSLYLASLRTQSAPQCDRNELLQAINQLEALLGSVEAETERLLLQYGSI